MSYDIKVMNSKTLGPAWRLAHNVPADSCKVGLTKICSSLKKCVESGRVSLGASSVLVNGAARVYEERADQLYKDCIELNKEMIERNRPAIDTQTIPWKGTHSKYTVEDSRNCIELNKEMIERNRPPIDTQTIPWKDTHSKYTVEDSRNCIELNKEMIERNRPPIDTQTIPWKGTHSKYTVEDSRKLKRNSISHSKYSNSACNYPYPIKRRRTKRSVTDVLEDDLSDEDKTTASQRSSKTTREIGVQTTESFISDRNKKKSPNPKIDMTQIFGLVMVCDKESWIPRKIAFSKINGQTL